MATMEDEALIRVAGRVADCLSLDGYAFVEDRKMLQLAAALRSFLEHACVSVNVVGDDAAPGSDGGDPWFGVSPRSVPDLVGCSEIKRLLGVNRQRAYQITSLHGFPEPLADLASGRVWRRDEVEAWINSHRPVNYAEEQASERS